LGLGKVLSKVFCCPNCHFLKSVIWTCLIQGRNKLRILSFAAHGSIYLTINAKHYADGEKQRDELLNAIERMKLIDQGIDPKEVISGRNSNVLLPDLDQGRLDAFLVLLKRYCV
jgi:hypothetical protein